MFKDLGFCCKLFTTFLAFEESVLCPDMFSEIDIRVCDEVAMVAFYIVDFLLWFALT